MRQAAYTLIELLAVIVILGLVAGVGSASLTRVVHRDQILEAVDRLRSADQRARRAARSTVLAVRLDAGGMETVRADGRSGERVDVDVAIALGWLTMDHRPITALTYDGRGRSDDCLVEVDDHHARRTFAVRGLTGEWDEVTP